MDQSEQPLTRELLTLLAQERLKEAKVLLGAGCWSGAYYLAGYAVELGLKAQIAKAFRAGVIPDKNFVTRIYSHRFSELAALGGLTDQIAERSKEREGFAGNWNIAAAWSEQARYRRNRWA